MAKLKQPGQKNLVITFENHPTTITNPNAPTPLIYPLEQKISLLKTQPIDALCLLPFTESLREMTADEFISKLEEILVLDTLILGPSSRFGYKKKGNQDSLPLLSKKYGFNHRVIDYVSCQQNQVSSSLIRELIKKADFELATKLLARPYELTLKVEPGAQIGRSLGFPTLNLNVDCLVLPPLGVYEASLCIEDKNYKAICNLGYAPTLQERNTPSLEVHVLDSDFESAIEQVNIQLRRFIRPEKKFSDKKQLIEQIKADIRSIEAS